MGLVVVFGIHSGRSKKILIPAVDCGFGKNC